MNQKRELPNWEQVYQNQAVESMPWFSPELDPDLDSALSKLNLQSGTVLDLGTGPGTQAIALAKRGFQVTATDLSRTAIENAQAKGNAQDLEIRWQQDDILQSQLKESFDLVFDRGCFHTFEPNLRQDYVRVVAGLVKPHGYLILKCFSHKETRPEGPYRFTPAEIEEIFGESFQVQSIQETLYNGTLNPPPLAIFCILQKS